MANRSGSSSKVALLLAAAILIAVSLLPALPSSSAAAPAATSPKYPVSPNAGSRGLSSIVLPIEGNVYPHGMYRVKMMVGEPAKPYFFDIDTGSDFTWLNCDAPCIHCPKCPHPLYKPVKSKLVGCKAPLCDAPGPRDCNANPLQCDYEIEYHDGGSSLGVLITDAFTFRLVNNSVVRPEITFGCGYDQLGNGFKSTVDGVIGLGCGAARSTFLSQMQSFGITSKVAGHCLGRRGGGFLFLGDASIPKNGITWAPISCSKNKNAKFYSPGSANVYVDKQHVGIVRLAFDSGSSYTYFSNQPYQGFLSAVKNEISRSKKLKETKDPALPICWKGSKPFRSVLDARNYFKKVTLSFADKALLVIPPENYLIVTNLGNACLGILNGTEVGLNDLSLIGDISMQDLMVVYDNEKMQIGWAPASCDRLPKSGNSHL